MRTEFDACWHCGRTVWLCDARHFWGPIFQGAAYGLLAGGALGVVLVVAERLFQWIIK
jgi:hypothetical protein